MRRSVRCIETTSNSPLAGHGSLMRKDIVTKPSARLATARGDAPRADARRSPERPVGGRMKHSPEPAAVDPARRPIRRFKVGPIPDPAHRTLAAAYGGDVRGQAFKAAEQLLRMLASFQAGWGRARLRFTYTPGDDRQARTQAALVFAAGTRVPASRPTSAPGLGGGGSARGRDRADIEEGQGTYGRVFGFPLAVVQAEPAGRLRHGATRDHCSLGGNQR